MENSMLSCVNWHSLPCLMTSNGKAVIFTNIDGELVACEVSQDKLYCEDTLKEMVKAEGFDCLNHMNTLQDEFTLVLSLTERCNAACRYCFLNAQTSGNVMTTDILHAAIDYVAKHVNNRVVNLAAFGGEPSVVPDLVREMISYGKKMINEPIVFSIKNNKETSAMKTGQEKKSAPRILSCRTSGPRPMARGHASIQGKTMNRLRLHTTITDEEMKIVNRTAEKLGYASRTELVTALPRDRGIPNQNTD